MTSAFREKTTWHPAAALALRFDRPSEFGHPGGFKNTGGASGSGGNSDRLQRIRAEISLLGGVSVASECDLPGSAGRGRVVLLQ